MSSALRICFDPVCVETDKANKQFELIKECLEKDYYIILSFDYVDVIIAHYLHIVIGQLYNHFSEDVIRDKLKVVGIKESQKELLKSVVDVAKRYFKS